MPWQTVDARPQKKQRKGEKAVEDAERRELRLRRTYNEAAAGHAAVAAKSAAAPPAAAVAALYEKILTDVGPAPKDGDAPWDATLRLACARHLSELLEAAGDRTGALAAACRAADAACGDAGLWLRVARLARAAEGVAAARVAVAALHRAAALRRAEREDDAALERAARAAIVKRACFRGIEAAAEAPPVAARTARALKTWTGLGGALLAARTALIRDARGGRATLDAPVAVEWLAEKKKKPPAKVDAADAAAEGKDDDKGKDEQRPRRGARVRGKKDEDEDDAVKELPLAARVFGELLDGAPPAKPPDGVAAAWFARAPAAQGSGAAVDAPPPSLREPRCVRDHLAAFVAAAACSEAAWAADDMRRIFAEAVAAVDGTVDSAALVALAEVDAAALGRAKLDPRVASHPDLAARLHWLGAEGAVARGDAFGARIEFEACARALIAHGGVDCVVRRWPVGEPRLSGAAVAYQLALLARREGASKLGDGLAEAAREGGAALWREARRLRARDAAEFVALLAGDALQGAGVLAALCATAGGMSDVAPGDAAAIARAATADRVQAGEALNACVAVLDALARTPPGAARATFCRGARGGSEAVHAVATTAAHLRALLETTAAQSAVCATGGDAVRAALVRTVAVAAAGSSADAVLDALATAASVDAVLGGATTTEAVAAAAMAAAASCAAALRAATLARNDADALKAAACGQALLQCAGPMTETRHLAAAAAILGALERARDKPKLVNLRCRAAAACVQAVAVIAPIKSPTVVLELHAHLAARKCCDGGDAVFLRACCALSSRRAENAVPGRRPVLGKDEEISTAQCYYCLVGAKVLRDGAASHTISDAARKRRAKHFADGDGFALFAAPLLLRDRNTNDEPPPALTSRKDLLVTLNDAAGASRRLAARTVDDDDVDAYLFAQKDAPQHWPGALLAGVDEAEPADEEDGTPPISSAATDAADTYVAEIMARRLLGKDKEAAQEESKAPVLREASLLDAAAWCARACACKPRDAARWMTLARCYEDLAAPLLSLNSLREPFAVVPPKRPLKAVARLPYAASNDAALQFAAPYALPSTVRAEAASTIGATRLETAKRAYALAHATSRDVQTAAAAAVARGRLRYADLRELGLNGTSMPTRQAAGDAQRCFEAALLIGDAEQQVFSLLMLGKIRWRADDYDRDERRRDAIVLFRRARDLVPVMGKPTGGDDPYPCYRLHAARLKVALDAATGNVTPLALQACRDTKFEANDGSVSAIIADCVRAFEACRKQDPYHARAACAQAAAVRAQPALTLAAATTSTNRFAAAADERRLAERRRVAVRRGAAAAKDVLEKALFCGKRPQVVALWRVEGDAATPRECLDADHRRYDRARLKYVALFADVLVDLGDHGRLRDLEHQICSARERSHCTDAMVDCARNARLKAVVSALDDDDGGAPLALAAAAALRGDRGALKRCRATKACGAVADALFFEAAQKALPSLLDASASPVEALEAVRTRWPALVEGSGKKPSGAS